MKWISATCLIVLTVWTSSLIAQRPPPPSPSPSPSPDQTLRATAEVFASRISRLAEQFDPPVKSASVEVCLHDCAKVELAARRRIEAEWARRRQLTDELAGKIHREVDGFITQAVTPADLNRESLESLLSLLLPAPFDRRPVAHISWQNRRRLAIAYMLWKGYHGPGGTSVTLRMYTERQGRLVLSGATGSDLDGYASISVVELPSPAPREAWFLLQGRLTGANGPNTRMRIYAFDGQRFRTVWMPENAWGDFDIVVSEGGFTVKGTYYRDGAREDRYAISDHGVTRIARASAAK